MDGAPAADLVIPVARRSFARAFTLLEAVLALAILSSVLVVCLSVRAEALAQRARLTTRLDAGQECEAIFEAIIGGVLPPSSIDPESGVRRWEGERAGFAGGRPGGRAFVVEARRIEAASPLASDPTRPRAASVFVWRYEVSFEGEKKEFLWHR